MKSIATLTFPVLVALGWPQGAAAVPVEVPVTLSLENGRCVPRIEAQKEVKGSTSDVLVFSFINECREAQAVQVCVKRTTSTVHATPWKECEGIPKAAPARLGASFDIAASTSTPARATALCSVHWPAPPATGGAATPESYRLKVVSGAAGNPLTCPPSGLSILGSELALEVLP